MEVKKLSFIFLLLIVLSVGCTPSTSANIRLDNNSAVYSETDATKIAIFADAKVNKAYLVIGEVVFGRDSNDSAKVIDGLCKQASLLGADAIINVRLECEYGKYHGGVKASGTAIKFKK